MRKTAFTILGVLLIAGPAVQVASASENHPGKVHRASAFTQDQSDFRGAYDAPFYYYDDYIPRGQQAVRERNRENFGFSGWDRSRPADFDPSLRPSD